MIKRLAFFCAAIFAAVSFAHANDEAHAMLKRIIDKYSHAKGIAATFTEHDDAGEVQGKIEMQGKTRFRVEVKDRLIVCNGVTIWIYTPSQNRVTIDSYHPARNSLAPEFFLANVPADARATIVKRDSGFVRLHLEPPSEDAWGLVKSLTLEIVERTAEIRRVEFSAEETGTSVVAIRSLSLDASISRRDFEFTPPPDAAIVDLRQK